MSGAMALHVHLQERIEELEAEKQRLPTRLEAEKALKLFKAEYVGQSQKKLWDYCLGTAMGLESSDE